MASPHPILDGEIHLSPQISLEYEPGGFDVRGHREAARKSERMLYIVYRHPDRFRFSRSYRSFISVRANAVSFWRGREEAVGIEVPEIAIVKSVHSDRFGRYAVVVHQGSDELPLMDEIKSARDAEHIALALTEFLNLPEEDDANIRARAGSLLEPPPDTWTLQVRRVGNALHVTNKWRNYVGVYWLALTNLVASIVPWAFAESLSDLWISLMFGWSVAIVYVSLALLVNRSETYLDQVGMVVHNHPMPWKSAPKIPLEDIRQFECEPAPVPSWNPPYSLRVGTTRAGVVTIARNLKESDALALMNFLKAEVHRRRQRSSL